jgi:hypothetical protein
MLSGKKGYVTPAEEEAEYVVDIRIDILVIFLAAEDVLEANLRRGRCPRAVVCV